MLKSWKTKTILLLIATIALALFDLCTGGGGLSLPSGKQCARQGFQIIICHIVYSFRHAMRIGHHMRRRAGLCGRSPARERKICRRYLHISPDSCKLILS